MLAGIILISEAATERSFLKKKKKRFPKVFKKTTGMTCTFIKIIGVYFSQVFFMDIVYNLGRVILRSTSERLLLACS